ncbi:MAG: DNA adenine methylase [Promethearchaeota archaeon]
MGVDIPLIVKWAGGKKQLLKQFEEHFPEKINRYFEPFVGGGAVFFFVKQKFKPNSIVLNDWNKDLVNVYKYVRDDVDLLISELEKHKDGYNKDYYYKIREEFNKTKDPFKRATLLLFLNRTCFNGLYRLNSKGGFNVPIGRYINPNIVRAEIMKQASELLKDADIRQGDFEKLLPLIKEGDFVYLDPPYHTEVSGFTTYTERDFSPEDQKRLAEFCKKLHEKGAKFMLSNSNTKFTRNLYKDFDIQFVKARRMINSVAEGRGEIKEIVVRNY